MAGSWIATRTTLYPELDDNGHLAGLDITYATSRDDGSLHHLTVKSDHTAISFVGSLDELRTFVRALAFEVDLPLDGTDEHGFVPCARCGGAIEPDDHKAVELPDGSEVHADCAPAEVTV